MADQKLLGGMREAAYLHQAEDAYGSMVADLQEMTADDSPKWDFQAVKAQLMELYSQVDHLETGVAFFKS